MSELPPMFGEQLRSLLPDEGYAISVQEILALAGPRSARNSGASNPKGTLPRKRVFGLKPALAWMLGLLVLVALGLGVGVGVGGSSKIESPLTAQGSLDKAIHAVLGASNFTLVLTEKGTLSPAPLTTVTTVTSWVIEKPDRISMEGTSGTGEIIAIGSTRYSEYQPGLWSASNSEGVSTNYTNGALLYVDMLLRAKSVVRQGNSYIVPSEAAAGLLTSTGLTQFQGISGASLSATVQAGLLSSIRLSVKGVSPYSMVATISRVGTSAAITAPQVGGSG